MNEDEYKVTIILDSGHIVTFFIYSEQIEKVRQAYIIARNKGYLLDLMDFLSSDDGCVVNLIDIQHVAQFAIEEYYGEDEGGDEDE